VSWDPVEPDPPEPVESIAPLVPEPDEFTPLESMDPPVAPGPPELPVPSAPEPVLPVPAVSVAPLDPMELPLVPWESAGCPLPPVPIEPPPCSDCVCCRQPNNETGVAINAAAINACFQCFITFSSGARRRSRRLQPWAPGTPGALNAGAARLIGTPSAARPFSVSLPWYSRGHERERPTVLVELGGEAKAAQADERLPTCAEHHRAGGTHGSGARAAQCGEDLPQMRPYRRSGPRLRIPEDAGRAETSVLVSGVS
jgi:hypothetical protein